ncbi:hypothetical protein BJX99DRAFT_263375 [Aspergillus californicus]
MDPFSLTVGIISAADVASRATAGIIGYLKDAKHASAERALLAKEAASLLSLLRNVRDRVRSGSFDSSVLVQQTGLVQQFEAACDGLATALGFDSSTENLKSESRFRELRTATKWFSTKKEVYAILERIARIEQHANTLLLTHQSDLLQRIDQRTQSAESKQLKKSLLEWLSTLQVEQDHHTTSSQALEGSGKWFLALPEVKDWLVGKEKFLWCYGIPGAGKTVITSIIVEDLRKQARQNNNIGVAFMYLKYNQPDQTFGNVIGSLLQQLLAPSGVPVSESLRKTFEGSRGPTAGDTVALNDLLGEMKHGMQYYQQVFIIVDALDECSDQFRWQLVEFLQGLNCHLIVTSRIPDHMDEELGDFKRVEIRANKADIELYIDNEINKDKRRLLKFMTRRPSLRQEIKIAVAMTADKMFLLARLHVDALKTALTINHVREMLKSLPENLDQTYDNAWERIESQPAYHKTTAHKTLGWVTYAFRALSLKELQHALAIERGVDFDEEDDIVEAQHIIDICAGLVTIDFDTKVVKLVHFTTKKYFDQHRQSYFPNFHESITMDCAVYLTLPTLRNATLWMIANKYPLAFYAAQYMAEHARESPEETLKPVVLREICLLLSQPKKRKPLLALLDGLDLVRSGVLSEPAADTTRRTADDIEASSQSSNDSQADLSVIDSAIDVITTDLAEISTSQTKSQPLEVTALHLAVSMGLTKVAATLLNETVDIDAVDDTGKTPLAVAMEKGFEKAVELLIYSGAQVDIRSEHGRGILLFVAERKWTGVRDMIVERAQKFVMEDAHVALLVAANSNSPDTKLAIDRIQDTRAIPDQRILETAMFLSVELDHLSAVEMFLSAGVSVNAKDHTGQTALHRATRCESESMIRALIAYGADVDAKNDSGKTPWRANLRNSNKGILDLLLTFGADPNTTNAGGVSELYSAAADGDVKLVKFLLHSGANPSIRTFFDWAPLHWAAHNEHIDCVKLLIQAGADVNMVSDQAKTPLDMALGCNHDAIAELLVAHGGKTHEELQSSPSPTATTHRQAQVSTLARSSNPSVATKVTLVVDQPFDEGYQWGQFIYMPEDTEVIATTYRPYQISHRLSTVTDFISIRVAEVRVQMAEYPLPPEKFPRQDILYDIFRMDIDYPELRLRANPDTSLRGDLTLRRAWTGNWQVHREDDQGVRRTLFRTIETNWLSTTLDEACRWNDENGVLLATSTISTITFESTLDRSLLDVLVSCWVAKLWSENLTRQQETAIKI